MRICYWYSWAVLFVCMVSPKGYSLPVRAAHWMGLRCFHAPQIKEEAGISSLERVMIVFGAFLRHTVGKMPLKAVDELVILSGTQMSTDSTPDQKMKDLKKR